MDKIELEHLAPYLPYDIYFWDEYSNRKSLLNGLVNYGEQIISLKVCEHRRNMIEIKPILHPLSDLTKPIKVEEYNDGKEFVPIEELSDNMLFIDNGLHIEDYFLTSENAGIFDSYRIIQALFQWHFDVFGLIEKKLAIDINILNK